MKKIIMGALFATVLTFAAGAQSAQKVSEIDESPAATYGQFSYLIATYSSTIDDSASYSYAFDTLKKTGDIDADLLSTDPVPLSVVAKICCDTWKINGSLMYKLTKAPRYAFRQLQALNIIPKTANPTTYPSGHQLLNIITRCIDFSSNGKED